MQRRSLAVIVLCLAPLALIGCKAAPSTLAQARAHDADPPQLWSKRGSAALSGPGRLALAEISVEFVTSKFETGDKRQAAFIPPHPVFLAAGAAGVGRKDIEFDDAAFDQIAQRVGQSLRYELTSRGWDVIDPAQTTTASAFAGFDALEPGEARPVSELNFAATDTGRVRTMRVLPTEGGRVITGPTGKREENARKTLLTELGADALLRAVIRVGVYNGRASFEEGSRLLLTTAKGASTLTAHRSLLSDTPVLDDNATNATLSVSQSSYLNAVGNSAPVFLRQAIDALER